MFLRFGQPAGPSNNMLPSFHVIQELAWIVDSVSSSRIDDQPFLLWPYSLDQLKGMGDLLLPYASGPGWVWGQAHW